MEMWKYDNDNFDIEEVIIDDLYKTLTKKKISWPIDLTECNRLHLVDYLITHYEDIEDFKKCKVLNDLRYTLQYE